TAVRRAWETTGPFMPLFLRRPMDRSMSISSGEKVMSSLNLRAFCACLGRYDARSGVDLVQVLPYQIGDGSNLGSKTAPPRRVSSVSMARGRPPGPLFEVQRPQWTGDVRKLCMPTSRASPGRLIEIIGVYPQAAGTHPLPAVKN